MYVTSHALSGAAIGAVTASAGYPSWVAFIAGFVSHAVLDSIPHHDYTSLPGAVVDLLLTGGVIWIVGSLYPTHYLWFWGLFGATIPDLEVGLKHLFPLWGIKLRYPSHSGLLPHPQIPFWPGVLPQILSAIICFGILIHLAA